MKYRYYQTLLAYIKGERVDIMLTQGEQGELLIARLVITALLIVVILWATT